MRRSPRRPTKRGTSCLSKTVLLGVVVLFLVAGYAQFVRPAAGKYIANQVSKYLGLGQPPGWSDSGSATPGSSDAQRRIQEQASNTMPTAIAALPRGEVRVTDTQINRYLAANPEALKPLESATVAFVPGQARATIEALGTTNQVTFGVAVQNGKVTVVEPDLDGPLGYLISFEDLTRTLERQLNEQLQAQERAITSVQIEQGAIVAVFD
jgi:hypothetical protein